jgi:Flp pilus assembly CpaE family ATPase
MTEKAQRILDKLKNRRAKKPSVDDVLQQFNASTLDDVGPIGAPDKQMRVLDEMNSLQQFENENWSRGSV